MLKLITLFIDLCRFRANPQDLPSSHILKYATILTYLTVGLAIAVLNQSLAQALVSVFVDLAMLLGLAHAGLWVRDFKGRTTQTITALTGTGTIIGLVQWPLMVWLYSLEADTVSMASFFLLILMVWIVLIIGHIMRHALSLPYWAGIGIAIGYVFIAMRVMSALFIAGS